MPALDQERTGTSGCRAPRDPDDDRGRLAGVDDDARGRDLCEGPRQEYPQENWDRTSGVPLVTGRPLAPRGQNVMVDVITIESVW